MTPAQQAAFEAQLKLAYEVLPKLATAQATGFTTEFRAAIDALRDAADMLNAALKQE